MKRLMRFMVLAVLPAAMLVSCDDDDDDVIVQKDTANVMVVHAAPDAPGVDLLIDDAKVNSSTLNYLGNTAYFKVEAGNRGLKVNSAGTATTVLNGNYNFIKDKNYTIFAKGTTIQDDPAELGLLIVEDDLTAPASGNAKVRFVHLSPDAPAVDIVNVTDAANQIVLFDAQSFEDVSSFASVPAGTYNLEVRADDGGAVIPIEGLTGLQLTAGKIYTVIARGFVTPPQGNTNTLGVQIIENKMQ